MAKSSWQHRRGTTPTGLSDRDGLGNSGSRTADQERPHFCIQLLPVNTPQLGFGNTKMIQHQGTSACFVGATPRGVLGQNDRLDPLPCRSKLGALQKRGVGLTQGIPSCFAYAFVPSLPEICAKHKWDKCYSEGECGLLASGTDHSQGQ